MLRKIVLIIIFAPITLYTQYSFAISGGIEVSIDDLIAHSVVLIYPTQIGNPICSGTLIASNLILTAGHCVSDHIGQQSAKLSDYPLMTPNQIVIYTGNFDSSRPANSELIFEVEEIRRAPDYFASDRFNDFGLIKLKRAISAAFVPAPMLTNLKASLGAGAEVTIAGYGMGVYNDQSLNQIFRKTDLRIEQPEDKHGQILLQNAGDAGMRAGDSGGPIFANVSSRLFVIGAASGYYDRRPGGSCESISSHASWIREQAKVMKVDLP